MKQIFLTTCFYIYNSWILLQCLLVIACTLPIISAEAERFFSLLRRMKTYIRSTLAEEHLSDLAVIAMHYSKRIPLDEVCHASFKLIQEGSSRPHYLLTDFICHC